MLALTDFVARFSLASSSSLLWLFVLVFAAVVVVSNFVISLVQQRRSASRSVTGVPGPAGHWLKGHTDYVSIVSFIYDYPNDSI